MIRSRCSYCCCAAEYQALGRTVDVESAENGGSCAESSAVSVGVCVVMMLLFVLCQIVALVTNERWVNPITQVMSNLAAASYSHWAGQGKSSKRNLLTLGALVVLCTLLFSLGKFSVWVNALAYIILALTSSCWAGQAAAMLPGTVIWGYRAVVASYRSCRSRSGYSSRNE